MKKNIFFYAVALCIALISTSCGEDNDSPKGLNYNDITIKAGETARFNANDFKWETSNKLIATVSGSTITGVRVGEASIYTNNTDDKNYRFKVTIEAKYNTYKEPYLKWGASKADVISYEPDGATTPTDDILAYKTTTLKDKKEMYVFYYFTNGKLTSVDVALPESLANDAISFLNERYVRTSYGDAEVQEFESLSGDKSTLISSKYDSFKPYMASCYAISYSQASK